MAEVYCGSEPCPLFLNSTCVFYTGESLLYIGVQNNDTLEAIIVKINQAFQNAGVGYAFTNGLIQPTPFQPVQLGGALIQNTTIGGNFTLTFAGNVQAARHITTGGTSSQFVKGDGTLDSTAYQPAANYITGLSGDATASGPGVAAMTLATVNFSSGTFGNGNTIPIVTVNAKGLVTNITPVPVTIPPLPLNFIGDVVGSGFTGSNITLLLQNVNPNPYNTITPLKFSVNGKGLVTSASPITASDIVNILGYSPGTSGTTGTSGTSGTTGTSGTSGTSGSDGTSGTSGTTGTSGTSGTDGSGGTSGTSGTSATAGTSGSSGTSGTTGTSGTSATSGTSGTSGTDGTGGTSGTSGSTGTSGSSGTSGTAGTSGTSGTTGSSGTSGTSGSTGTSGSSGTTGTSGSSGTTGTSGSSGTSGTTGVDGTSGTSGTTGTSGSSGLSGDRFKTTSTTTYTLQAPGNPGTLTVDPGLAYTVAQSIIIAFDANNHNEAEVTSYNSVTGVINFVTFTLTGSGTYSNWFVNIDGASGGDGSSGSSGTSGTSATAGTSGTTGTSGSSGTSGTTGTSGSSGTSGTSATNGTGGTSGTSGSSGTSGTTGTSGTSATSGTSGTSATSGTTGTSGTSGTNGTGGTSGTSGSSATSGTSGTSGILGSATLPLEIISNNISIRQASGSQNGFLSSTDWTTFNNKANTNQTMHIGTTAVAINRASGALSLSGVSIDGSAGSVAFNNITSKTGGTGTYQTSGDFRAPIFYDSIDSGYYMDLDSFSNIRALSTGGAFFQFGVFQLAPSANFGNGVTYLRVHPVSSGARTMSFRITINSNWNWVDAFGFISADVSFHFDGASLYEPSTTITSATGRARLHLGIGQPAIVSGFIVIPIFSSNTNSIATTIEGALGANFNDFSFTPWQNQAFPGAAVVSVPGALAVGGNITMAGATVATQDWTGGFLHQGNGGAFANLDANKDSRYVSFDQSSPTGAPAADWFNGFVSTHANYLSSYIINQHRTGNWYLGWRDGTTSLSSTWRLILHSGNFSSYAVPITGYDFGTTFSMGTMFVSTGEQFTPSFLLGAFSNGYTYKFPLAGVQSWLGLGNYLPLTGGTLTGPLTITTSSDGALTLRVPSGDPSEWNYINFVGSNGVRDAYFGTDGSGNPQWWRDDNSLRITLGSVATINDVQIVTNSGTWAINVTGTSTSISSTSPQLAASVESNSIYVTSPVYTTGQITKPLIFDWYNNYWAIGNVRSAATPSNGFGIAFQNNIPIHIFTTTGLSINGNTALHSGNFSSFALPIRGISNWNDNTVINNVIGMLAWKNYGNGHIIFDASNSTAPNGSSISNANPQNNWTGTFPTLMGWNGANTYGVRVDSARISDNTAGNADTVDLFHASQSTIANGIVVRDPSGYIFGNYINMSDDGNPGGGTAITSFITKQGDNYYRSVSPASAMASIRGVASGTWSIAINGNSNSTSNIGGADWQPTTNINLNQTANSQEWSFDIRRNGFTGGFWHVWDSALGPMLRVDADNGKVSAPYNFVGNLEGNASTVSNITGNTGLMINRLTPAFNIDGLTNSNFRSTLFGTTAFGEALATSRWNNVPPPLSGMNMYGTMIAWSGSDTHGFLAMDYNSPIARIGGGNGNNINWSAWVLHSSNFNSYAPTLGGTGATGTWPIAISGNSATTSQTFFSTLSATNFYPTNTWVQNAIYFGNGNNYFNWDGARIAANVGIQSSVDMRAPMFYDSQNPGYYLDPAGFSNLRAVHIDGYTQFALTTPGQAANFGNGRVYLRIHPVSSGARIISFKMMISSTWNWAPAFGYISADVSFYFDGSGFYNNTTTITSATGDARVNLNIGQPIIENGFVSVPIFSVNTNSIFVKMEGSPSFDWNAISYGPWESVGFPGPALVRVPGAISVGGTLSVSSTSSFDAPMTISASNDGLLTLRTPSGDSNEWNYIQFVLRNGTRRAYFGLDASGVPLWTRDDNGLSVSLGSAFTVNGGISATGDVVAFASSDRRLKDNITSIKNPLEKINKIGGYSFTWNSNQDTYSGNDYGVVAQEIEEIFPELVRNRDNGYKAVKYEKLIPLLIESIKELNKEVELLKLK